MHSHWGFSLCNQYFTGNYHRMNSLHSKSKAKPFISETLRKNRQVGQTGSLTPVARTIYATPSQP